MTLRTWAALSSVRLVLLLLLLLIAVLVWSAVGCVGREESCRAEGGGRGAVPDVPANIFGQLKHASGLALEHHPTPELTSQNHFQHQITMTRTIRHRRLSHLVHTVRQI